MGTWALHNQMLIHLQATYLPISRTFMKISGALTLTPPYLEHFSPYMIFVKNWGTFKTIFIFVSDQIYHRDQAWIGKVLVKMACK